VAGDRRAHFWTNRDRKSSRIMCNVTTSSRARPIRSWWWFGLIPLLQTEPPFRRTRTKAAVITVTRDGRPESSNLWPLPCQSSQINQLQAMLNEHKSITHGDLDSRGVWTSTRTCVGSEDNPGDPRVLDSCPTNASFGGTEASTSLLESQASCVIRYDRRYSRQAAFTAFQSTEDWSERAQIYLRVTVKYAYGL
jgi:hypothetical protein